MPNTSKKGVIPDAALAKTHLRQGFDGLARDLQTLIQVEHKAVQKSKSVYKPA